MYVLAAATLLWATGCGEDGAKDETGDTTTATSTGTTGTVTTGTGSNSTGTTTGTGTGTGTGTTTGTTSTSVSSPTLTTPSDCATWLLTYDLTGSKLFIDSDIASYEVTLEEPYSDDLNMGPGQMTIRVPDVGGAPGAGRVDIVAFQMTQDYSVGVEGFVYVRTNIEVDSGEAICGLVSGDQSAAGADVSWPDPNMPGYCQNGSVSCTGILCGTSGSPEEGSPITVEDECGPMPLNGLQLSADYETLGMTPVVLRDKDGSVLRLGLMGSQTSAVLDEATPKCACP